VNAEMSYEEVAKIQEADPVATNTWLQEINFETGPVPEIINNAKLNITNGMYGSHRATYFTMRETG
jgi:hypothetical protein